MEDTNKEITITGLEELFNKQAQDMNGAVGKVEALLSDWSGKFNAAFKDKSGVEKEADVIPANKAALADVKDYKLGGVQVVPVLSGMFVAVFATELIDGLVPKFMSTQTTKTQSYVEGGVKIGAAAGAWWLGKKYGDKIPIIGKFGMNVIALLTLFDGVRSLVPLDQWAKSAANKVSGVMTTTGLALNVQSQNREVPPVYADFIGGGR